MFKISMERLLTVIFAGLALSVSSSAFAQDADDQGAKLMKQVYEVFDKKCANCHGSQLVKPKGKFGNVLDFRTLVKDPDMIVPGDPEDSYIFLTIIDEEMPPKKSDTPPLTEEETKAVKTWIKIGAPVDSLPEYKPRPKETEEEKPESSDDKPAEEPEPAPATEPSDTEPLDTKPSDTKPESDTASTDTSPATTEDKPTTTEEPTKPAPKKPRKPRQGATAKEPANQKRMGLFDEDPTDSKHMEKPASLLGTGNLEELVLEIFENKCWECHGFHMKRPKGKFGYARDLRRLKDNEDMIVPGDPDDSEIWILIEEGDMPPDDSDTPQLTPEEKEVVKTWIAQGAPTKALGSFEPWTDEEAGLKIIKERMSGGSDEEAEPTISFPARVIRFFGRMHPVLVHFPIALLMFAPLAEILGFLTKKEWFSYITRFLVTFGALTAFATMLSGLSISGYNEATNEIYATHESLGYITTFIAFLTLIVGEMAHRKQSKPLRIVYIILLLACVPIVGLTGHYGGGLIYGLDHVSF